MQSIIDFCGSVGGVLWGPWTFFILMGAGILFTLWTKFTQYTALTHGFAVVRGRYDDPDDPGAINHFQALSAALSATIGLGNIGGVALAIAAGGPGSLFWMWIIGFLGMALKTVEITLAMMYRNTDDPDNPHGGAMWVVERVIGGKGGVWKTLARIIGVFFCVTLLISTITGGNMFQAWSVADLTEEFWGAPPIATGIVLAVVVGLVIIGGIKRIGSVAGKLVPLMCGMYLIAALSVLAVNVSEIPAMLALIVKSAFQDTQAGGAFLGGTLGWAFSTGLRRALFSNEAGQGSAPIAHSAAKTNEPAREGIVGGMGPFIDTICICTLTALVILLTGTWNRAPLMNFDPTAAMISPTYQLADSPLSATVPVKAGQRVSMKIEPPAMANMSAPIPADRVLGTVMEADGGSYFVRWMPYTAFGSPSNSELEVRSRDDNSVIGSLSQMPLGHRASDDQGTPGMDSDDVPIWGLLTAPHPVEITDDNAYLWEKLSSVFVVVHGDPNPTTNTDLHKLTGRATRSQDNRISATWSTMVSAKKPRLTDRPGLHRDYNGASLTAHAFDRQFPGLGKILITLAAWLFAISTMISWSYYGEQGVVYILGSGFVLPYKVVFLILAVLAATSITDTSDMEALMDLGTGAMLWANIPIVVVLGFLAVRSLGDYGTNLKAGRFTRHDARRVTDLADGEDT